jgi:hypothetical protein
MPDTSPITATARQSLVGLFMVQHTLFWDAHKMRQRRRAAFTDFGEHKPSFAAARDSFVHKPRAL